MLKVLKQQVLGAARGVRLLEAVGRSSWRRRRLLVLCYHSLAVDQEHEWRRALFFTPEEFDARLELIRKYRLNVLPLGEAVERLQDGTLPERSAALTFDDGSADFHDLVAPRLARLGYPATVYVTTYYVEKGLPIFHLMVSYLLWKGRHRRLEPDGELGLTAGVDLSDQKRREELETVIESHVERLRLDAPARARFAEALAVRLGVDYGEILRRRVLQLMTPEEIRHVSAQGFDVQLHTHRHRTPRVREQFSDEILENRRRIEAMTGRATTHFCYPRGVHFPEYGEWLPALGVESGTTCAPGLAEATSPRLFLPRVVDTAGLSPIEFEGWLSGLSHFLPRRSQTERSA
jgi:peptidoglycan/xylan/chitin deacetylase (PgdA/CDA1 family)